MAKVSEAWSAQQQRQLSFISEFMKNVRHVARKSNQVANCLYRSMAGAVYLGVDYTWMTADQVSDADVQAYRMAITGLWLADVPFTDCGATILCDVSPGQPRPVICRRRVFDTIHSLFHPGGKASWKLVVAKFIWHGLKKDWPTACMECLAVESAPSHQGSTGDVRGAREAVWLREHGPGGPPAALTGVYSSADDG